MTQHDFILLDRSGSMSGSMWTEALSSINAYVKKLADDNVDTGVTLVAFDTFHNGLDFAVLRDRIIPKTWKSVTVEDADPRGGTPLNDATARLVALAEQGNYEKVAIVIITDGQENSSREFPNPAGAQKIKEMLDRCRAKNWQVIFLGADFDNAAQAASYGTAAAQTVRSSEKNLAAAMGATARMRSSYASTGAAMEFSEDEKEKLASR